MRKYYYAFWIFILFCLIHGFSSCSYDKKLAKWCARCPIKTTVVDSVPAPKITATPFDTTLWIKNHHGKEIVVNNCDSLYALLARNNGTVTTTENGVKATIMGGVNKPIKFKCETDSLKEVIRLMKIQVHQDHFRTVTVQVPARCEKNHQTGFETFLVWSGGILWIALILFVGWQVVRRWFSAGL